MAIISPSEVLGGMSEEMEVVSVKRERLAACMTCGICHNLLNKATVVSECLHTFCKDCIFMKLTEEELHCCPVCKLDLGPSPLQKLRTDNNLQEVRAKLFPCKRGTVNPLEAPSVSVVNTQVGTDTASCGNEMREFTRKSTTSHGLSLDTNGIIEKENINTEFCAENPNSPVILNKVSHYQRQNSPEAETPCITYNKDTEQDADKDKLSKTLECLGKAAFSPQSCIAMTDQTKDHDTDLHIPKTMVCEHPNESIAKDRKNDDILASERSGEAKRLRRVARKKELAAQALLDAAAGKHDRGTSPVWVTLVASADQDGNAPLPQLLKNFLRIKNCSLPSSFLQKYIAKKLNLSSETEVDISCRGQPVYPTTPLHGLVDMWVQKEPSNKVQVLVGSSAKDFVVAINYRRKAPPRQWTDFSNHGALSNPFKSSLELQQVSGLC